MLGWLAAGVAALALWPPAPTVINDPQDAAGLDITSASLVQQATQFQLQVTVRQRWLPDYLDAGGPRSLCLVVTQGTSHKLCVTGHHAVLRRDGALTPASVSTDGNTLLAAFAPTDVGLALGGFTWHVESRWVKAPDCAHGCFDRTDEQRAEAKVLAVPECFGAAARDPWHRCSNPGLADTVTPTPDIALITPNAPCVERKGSGEVLPCVFGVPPAESKATFALIGDSHAEHWRAALEVVAQAEHWRGISVARTSCPFNEVAVKLPTAALTADCKRWNGSVRAWLHKHPEIHTVITAGHSLATFDGDATQGFRATWQHLPKTVRHIYVLRDTPTAVTAEESCVAKVLRRHQPIGAHCAQPRAKALRDDPAAHAAAHPGDPRVKLLNLTPQLCSAKVCPPVIGGVLVRKDGDHLTRLFSTTLGPFVLRAIQRA